MTSLNILSISLGHGLSGSDTAAQNSEQNLESEARVAIIGFFRENGLRALIEEAKKQIALVDDDLRHATWKIIGKSLAEEVHSPSNEFFEELTDALLAEDHLGLGAQAIPAVVEGIYEARPKKPEEKNPATEMHRAAHLYPKSKALFKLDASTNLREASKGKIRDRKRARIKPQVLKAQLARKPGTEDRPSALRMTGSESKDTSETQTGDGAGSVSFTYGDETASFTLDGYSPRDYRDLVGRDAFPDDRSLFDKLAKVEGDNRDLNFIEFLTDEGFDRACPTRDDFHRDRVNAALGMILNNPEVRYSQYQEIPLTQTLSKEARSRARRGFGAETRGHSLTELREVLLARLRSGGDEELNELFREAIINGRLIHRDALRVAGSSKAAKKIVGTAEKAAKARASKVENPIIVPGNDSHPGFTRAEYDSFVRREAGLDRRDPVDLIFIEGLDQNNETIEAHYGGSTRVNLYTTPDLGRFNEDRSSFAIDRLIAGDKKSFNGYSITGRPRHGINSDALDKTGQTDLLVIVEKDGEEFVVPLQIKSSNTAVTDFNRESDISAINAHGKSLSRVEREILSAVNDSKIFIPLEDWGAAVGSIGIWGHITVDRKLELIIRQDSKARARITREDED